jgi:hypothetical protein
VVLILENRGNLLILIKIYQRYHTFDVQFVMICPLGTAILIYFDALGVHRFTMAFLFANATD